MRYFLVIVLMGVVATMTAPEPPNEVVAYCDGQIFWAEEEDHLPHDCEYVQ